MKCTTNGCGNKQGASGKQKYSKCFKCRSNIYKNRKPLRYTYCKFKNNADRRGIKFLISYQDFLEFCAATGYMQLKGVGPDDMTIDRIDSELGYLLGNIRMISNKENSQKQ